MPKTIFFITGASGVGKTTLISRLKFKHQNTDNAFLHFDSTGVPSFDEMIKEFGSPSLWQEQKTYQWIEKIIFEIQKENVFFEGQTDLNFIVKGFNKYNFKDYRIILIDCNEIEMSYRLSHKRNQPHLFNDEMKNWLKYLRNQAQELNIPILDTSNLSEQAVLTQFEELAGL